jgi:hypothetical protein
MLKKSNSILETLTGREAVPVAGSRRKESKRSGQTAEQRAATQAIKDQLKVLAASLQHVKRTGGRDAVHAVAKALAKTARNARNAPRLLRKKSKYEEENVADEEGDEEEENVADEEGDEEEEKEEEEPEGSVDEEDTESNGPDDEEVEESDADEEGNPWEVVQAKAQKRVVVRPKAQEDARQNLV